MAKGLDPDGCMWQSVNVLLPLVCPHQLPVPCALGSCHQVDMELIPADSSVPSLESLTSHPSFSQAWAGPACLCFGVPSAGRKPSILAFFVLCLSVSQSSSKQGSHDGGHLTSIYCGLAEGPVWTMVTLRAWEMARAGFGPR